MKKFIALYLGSPTSPSVAKWEALDEASRKTREMEGMKGWQKWVTEHQASIVEMGGPAGDTKSINSKGITDMHNQVTGFTIVQAESHEAAAKLFVNHPHFAIFPGDSVEVMECLPIPGAH